MTMNVTSPEGEIVGLATLLSLSLSLDTPFV